MAFLRLPYREDKVFSLIFFLFFLTPLAFSVFLHENFETVKAALFILLIGLAVILFLRQHSKSRLEFQASGPLVYLLSFFVVLVLLSTLSSVDRLYSFFGFYYRFTGGFLFLSAFAALVFLLHVIGDRGRLNFLLKVLIADAAIIAIFSILQSFGVLFYEGSDAGGFMRAPGLLGNPNFTSMFLAAVLPFIPGFMLESHKIWVKLYYGLTAVLIVLAVALSASRGALLALVASLLVLGSLGSFYKFSKKKILIFGGIFALVLVLAGYLLMASRPQAINSVLKSADENTFSRLLAWQTAWEGIRIHPLLGSGPGTFALFYERQRQGGLGSTIGVFDDAHNLYLQLGATIGLPFVISFFGLLAFALYWGFKAVRGPDGVLALAAISSLIAWLIGSAFNPVPVPMYLLLAIVTAFLLLPANKNLKLRLPVAAVWTSGGYAVMLVVCAVLFLAAEQIFYFSEMAYLTFQYPRAYKLSGLAAKINPTNQLYRIYHIGSGINMGLDKVSIRQQIDNFKNIHPLSANNFVEASKFYALLYDRERDKQYLSKAAENMEQALKIDAYFPERYGQLALYDFQLGDLEKSKIELLRALDLKNTDFSSYLLLAKIYQQEGKKDQTLFALNRAFRLRPEVIQLRYLIAWVKTVEDVRSVPIQITARRTDIR